MSHLQNIVKILNQKIEGLEGQRAELQQIAKASSHQGPAFVALLLFDGMILHCTDRPTFLLLTYPENTWQLTEYPVSVLNRDKFPTIRYILTHEHSAAWYGSEECVRVIAQHWGEHPNQEELAEAVERFKGFEERLK